MGSQKACSAEGGKGFSRCIFGRFERQCRIQTCRPGYTLTGFPLELTDVCPMSLPQGGNPARAIRTWSYIQVGVYVAISFACIVLIVLCCCSRQIFGYRRIPTMDIADAKNLKDGTTDFRGNRATLRASRILRHLMCAARSIARPFRHLLARLRVTRELDVFGEEDIELSQPRKHRQDAIAARDNPSLEVVDAGLDRNLHWVVGSLDTTDESRVQAARWRVGAPSGVTPQRKTTGAAENR